MRPTLLLLSAIAPGCAAPCPGPEQISGVAYDVFATVLTFGEMDDATLAAGSTPANGPSVWSFEWGATATGPITVVIDDQALEGTGSWSTVECGSFTVELDEGSYVAPDDPAGTIHELRLSGIFVAYDDRLEGSGSYAETWTSPATADRAAESGVLNIPELQLRGITTSAP